MIILVLLVSGGGMYTATQLKMESMPDISFPVIVALTPYPGASPQDIDEKVTQPIEKAIRGIDGLQKTQTISADSTSVLIAQFDFDADLDKAQQEMRDAIDKVKLPEQALDPVFNRFGFNTLPIFQLSVTSNKKSPAELEHWVNDEVKPALESISGIGEIQVKGEGPKAVYIRLDPDKLKKHNLSFQQVQQSLQAANLSFPTGDLNQGSIELPVRVEQKIRNINDLKNYELTLQPNMMEGVNDAFNQIGKGFQGLGQAVGGLGQAVGGLGDAVGGIGQSVGQLGQGVGMLQAQTSILQKMQDVEAKFLGTTIALSEATAKLAQNPDDPVLKNRVITLKNTLIGLTNAYQQLNQQLNKITAQMPKVKSGAAKGKVPSAPKAKGGTIPKTGGFSTKQKDPEIKTIKLSEIATITESAEDNSLITRTDGKPSVNIDIIKNRDANIVEVADMINEKIAKLNKQNPDMKIDTLLDQSEAVKESIFSMVREGALGALFAALVILLFLRNFRMTIISVVSIPVSIFFTLIILHQADITLNIMTLGGLAVAIGRVVDDSIVVIENIYRHLKKGTVRDENLIAFATKEVASAITSSTLTTVAVFIPLGLVDGIVGKVFYPFALTVAVALLSSLLVAVTIVPVMAKLLLLRGKAVRMDRTRSRSAETYKKALSWSLNHKSIVILGSVVLLVASMFLVPLIGTSFLPSDKDKAMKIDLKLPSGTELAKTNDLSLQIEKRLDSYPQIERISTTVGNVSGTLSPEGTVGNSSNRAAMFVRLDRSVDMEEMLAKTRADLKKISQEAEIKVSEVNSVGPTGNGIQVNIKGADIEEIKKVADELTSKMKTVSGLANVSNNLSAYKDLVTITVDEQKAAQKGLNAQMLGFTLRGLLQADKVLEFEQGTKTQEVKLGYIKENASSVEELKKVEVLNQIGQLVKLGDVATIKQEKGPVSIQRLDGREYATVVGNAVIKDTGKLSADVQALIDKMNIPEGINVQLGGDTEEMEKSFAQLGVAMIVAIAAVYIVMLISFGEATAPFTILFSLPFAIIGGLLGLYMVQQPISVPSMIGALMLIGIVVTNAIVLIDRVQQQRERGLEVHEALLEAAGTRLRPILMTALATIFALLPLGLGFGEGTLISQGLAVVVIGGLATSTLLTLFIVPVIYQMLSGIQARFSHKKQEA